MSDAIEPPQVHSILDQGKFRRSAGGRLERARCLTALSVEEVASQLKLPVRHISAIESDDFESFSSPIFLQGYLRNYARLVGVDPELIIELYREQHIDSAETSTSEIDSPEELAVRFSKNTIMGGVVAVAMLIFAAGQLLLGGSEQPESVSQQASIAPGQMVIEDKPPATQVAVEVTEADPVEELVAQVQQSIDAESPEPVNLSNLVSQGQSAVKVSEQSELVDGQPVVELKEETVTGTSKIRIELSGQCWLEVADSNGARIAYGLFESGDQIEGQGVPPFDTVLGDATVAQVYIDDQMIGLDLESGKRSLKTRLSAIQ